MKSTVYHKELGEIVYEESFWTGKRELTVSGQRLAKQNKNTFILNYGGEEKVACVKGSYITSAKLYIGGETVELTSAAKWYEYVLACFVFVLIISWGNSPQLCTVIPVIGGAFGGGISGAMAYLCLVLMKNQKNVLKKVGIWLAMLAATFVLCALLAFVFLLAM